MDAAEITLNTINKGAVAELFQKHLTDIIENIRDPNTKAKQPRKIFMEFTVTPFPDRSGGNCEMTKCTSSLGDLDVSSVSCTIYFAKRDGKWAAFTRDLRQELLFEEKAEAADGKSSAAGE